MAIWPFIITKLEKNQLDKEIIYHERIHFRQQLEWFFVGFFILYFLEYLFNIFKYRNTYKAYRKISFEQEAYTFENDFNYLKNRKRFANYRKQK